MASKIVLISDDSDFFEYIRSKLELRKSDELYTFSFDTIPEKIHLLETSVLIVNSENSKEKTMDLLRILRGTPVIVSAYNDDEVFRRKCYRIGMFDYITLLTSDADFRARILPALSVAGILEQNKQYRNVLVQSNILSKENEVYLDYNYILERELQEIHNNSTKAIFAAISPSEKSKFLIASNLIESTILNNIRRNDILMNYAPNKYFLLMYDTDIKHATVLWNKIQSQFSQKIYAGFTNVLNQKRQQLVNEALNKLHEAMNYDKDIVESVSNPVDNFSILKNGSGAQNNFKLFKQAFGQKLEQVITPVFYQIQQKYSREIRGAVLQQGSGEGYGTFYIKGKNSTSCFRITSPGFAKINIDITYQKGNELVDAKRISLEPEELEAGLLEDLLEQFILEYKKGY
jgi:hypothetical protein